jgi:hypothetical protein
MNEYRLPGDTNPVTLELLRVLVNTIPARLRKIPESDFSYKPSPSKWSKKEIIGHLIDSATHNHHRFVRGQFEDNPVITYDQDQWNTYSFYQALDSAHVIMMWEVYNHHIVQLMSHMPESHKGRHCRMDDEHAYTIAWLFDDYVRHMEHHLRQVGEFSLF